ncbi:monovalent cation/H(+) antiporter subunit G [Streptomyces sp. Tu 3180]|uniref:monovalent cation/H(+) antiporter subunit G n=1 Tax=Streptomyces sp. Tu 3180 TaxID=2682611 RepID=UPI0013568F7E|nr:monovalent cation/H(+) antiporter subunit G [Streptomyces sp. Tu 3180]KAF3468968.1 monovalent cation/H(+) antiporter subunit G [Streptomyces sp. Tu 3180]
MTVLRDAVTAVLFLTGACFCLLGALGLLRFPGTVSRLHAAAKAQTLGLLLVLVGAAVHLPLRNAPVLLLVALFQLFNAPITSQIVGRIAYRTDAVDRGRLFTDELADRLARDGTPLHGHGGPAPDAAGEGERRDGTDR